MDAAEVRLRRLLDVGRTIVAEREPEAVLEKILDQARELTGARYAALGVLNEERTELARFLTSGIDASTHRAIGELPRGRGVLGVLILEPRPLRLSDVTAHPESFGFPAGHPEMHSFLGVPILIRGQPWGNLYLTEKEADEQFTAEDEEAATTLAQWAGIAIENSRVLELSERQRSQLERAVQSLEASRAITEAVGGVADLDRVFELIVKRGRALVEAHSLLVMLREGDELVVAACAGHAHGSIGRRLPISGSSSGQVLERRRSQQVNDVVSEMRIDPAEFGVADARTALLVPMMHRGEAVGILAAFDHGSERGAFHDEDEGLLQAFAQSAANAVAIKRSVEADRLRSAIASADAERARWARELHDQTLQALGGLRVLLAASAGRGDEESKGRTMRQAIEDIELEIANLRHMITDLRPSLLDDLGLRPAIEALVERRRNDSLRVESRIALPDADGSTHPLSPELETTVYRLIQEALTNVAKHAQARKAQVRVALEGAELVVEIQDDGQGFGTAQTPSGFGLTGMRERVDLTGGTLSVESGPEGTIVTAHLPAREHGSVLPLHAKQVAS